MRLFERDDFQPRTFKRGNRKPLKRRQVLLLKFNE